MLTGIHFLLTYACNFECDHCFLYCGPKAEGTFTIGQVREVLDEVVKIGSVEWIYFEGGEPLLYFPLLLEGLRTAKEMGFKTGIVTNSYMATSDEDAELWLKPLRDLGITQISVSEDSFHGEGEESPARRALMAARRLGLSSDPICIDPPTVEAGDGDERERGAPVIGGGALFKGRAVEKLTGSLPRRDWKVFKECRHEDLRDPGRVHVDAYGNVHLCQGVSIGNMWKTPLSRLVEEYVAEDHPICGPLVRGGPALLTREYDVEHEDAYVDECHLCFRTRRALIDRFPEHLAPRQVYGLESDGGS